MDTQSHTIFNLARIETEVSPLVTENIKWSNNEWKFLSGAPAGSRVLIDFVGTTTISILIVNEELFANPFQIVLVFDDAKRPLYVLPRKLEIIPKHQRKGIATRMIARSMSRAAFLGFKLARISAVQSAASSTSMPHNGAYTSAMQGFDGRLSESIVEKLPSDLWGCITVLDLVETAGGQDFWRQNAESMTLQFDLAAESRSWAVLTRYMKNKHIQIID